MNKLIVGGGVALGVGLLAALGYAQVAGGVAAAPKLIPYVGHLDHDGQPVTGKVAMLVCLVQNSSASCDLAPWKEEFKSVDVAGGNFSLVLGQSTAIPDTIYNAPNGLYIRAMVGAFDAGGAPTYVQLSGAQRLLSVPYAVNVNQATNFRVEGQIYKGSTVPATNVPGITSQNAGEGLAFASNGGDIVFSRSANSGNGFTPPTNTNMLTIQANGVALGEGSFPIRQITYCQQVSSMDGPNKQVWFQNGECSHGLPRGICFGMLSRGNDCGGAVSWSIQHPQDNVNGASGMRWYNEDNCGQYHVAATFLCAY